MVFGKLQLSVRNKLQPLLYELYTSFVPLDNYFVLAFLYGNFTQILVPARSLCSVWQDVSSSVSERNLAQSYQSVVPFSVERMLYTSVLEST